MFLAQDAMQATCLQRRQVISTSRRHATAAARSRTRRLHCDASVVWRQLEGTKAWVAHPRAARVNGVIHFLGGAFAGAAPQLLYNGFIELLADAGYTTIATPYAVTFRHDQCAKAVRMTFLDSVSELRSSGRSYLVPTKAPCFGVGHSNGALLHLLIGSLEPGATQANVIISYNNLQVSDAIPIPGFLEGLQPTVQAARSTSSSDKSGSSSSSGRASPGLPLPQLTSQQVLIAAAATAPVLSIEQRQLLAGAAPALDQLASVINEVGDGLTDFRPTPEESRALIAAGYSCPATLLVQFENDNFDETPEMQQILSARLNSLSNSSSSSSSGDSTPVGTAAEATAAAAAAADSASQAAAAAAAVDAWSSVDEDVDIDRVLQQLQQLQQQQRQGWHQQQPGFPGLQALLLQGSHVTPCGAQVGGREQNNSSSDLKNLASKVLGWLESARRAGIGSSGGMAAAASRQQQMVAPGVAAGSGSVQLPAAEAVAAGSVSAAQSAGGNL